MTSRTPFEDTSVPVQRSQDQIRKWLRAAGAQGVQFTEEWAGETKLHIRFSWPMEQGHIQMVKLTVKPLPFDRRFSLEQRERQAWRGLAHYLEGTLKAATFGLIRFEDIFLSFMELEPMGRTIGQVVIPQVVTGQFALPPGDS